MPTRAMSHADAAMHVLRRTSEALPVREIRDRMVELGMRTNNVGGISHRVRCCLQNLKRDGRIVSPKKGFWELSPEQAARNPFRPRTITA